VQLLGLDGLALQQRLMEEGRMGADRLYHRAGRYTNGDRCDGTRDGRLFVKTT
jgi:hypothetical protein